MTASADPDHSCTGPRSCPLDTNSRMCFLTCSSSTSGGRVDFPGHSRVTTPSVAHPPTFPRVHPPGISHPAFLPLTSLPPGSPTGARPSPLIPTVSRQQLWQTRLLFIVKIPAGLQTQQSIPGSRSRGAGQGQPVPCWADTEGGGSCCGRHPLFGLSCSLGPTS